MATLGLSTPLARNTRTPTPAAAGRSALSLSVAVAPQPRRTHRRCVRLLAQPGNAPGSAGSGPGESPMSTSVFAATSRPDIATSTTNTSSTNTNTGASPLSSASSTTTTTSTTSSTRPRSRREILQELLSRANAPGAVNVYGKPFTKSELTALQVLVDHLLSGSGSSKGKAAAAAANAAAEVAGGLMMSNAAAGATTSAAPSVTAVAATLAAAAAADGDGAAAAAMAAFTEDEEDGGGGGDAQAALEGYLMRLLTEAALARSLPLPRVEGALVALELMAAGERGAAAAATDPEPEPDAFASRRWQLVVGADVGAVQYIPAVEELETAAATGPTTFTLGTDLDFIFTGFSGPCEWLAPGHLAYTVRQVRIEARVPKAWRRAAAWVRWLQARGGSGSSSSAAAASPAGAGEPAAAAAAAAATAGALRAGAGEEPEWGDSLPYSQTCREDPHAPHVNVGLPFFPANEILAFRTDGVVAATRSRLGGLILMLEVGAREAWRQRQQQQQARL